MERNNNSGNREGSKRKLPRVGTSVVVTERREQQNPPATAISCDFCRAGQLPTPAKRGRQEGNKATAGRPGPRAEERSRGATAAPHARARKRKGRQRHHRRGVAADTASPTQRVVGRRQHRCWADADTTPPPQRVTRRRHH